MSKPNCDVYALLHRVHEGGCLAAGRAAPTSVERISNPATRIHTKKRRATRENRAPFLRASNLINGALDALFGEALDDVADLEVVEAG